MPVATSNLIHIFVDHSNLWGGARGASRLKNPDKEEMAARLSVKILDRILGGRKIGVSTKIVSGGIPPGMEGVWAEYQKCGYDTQRLVRDDKWKERGVDHTIIGHMWRLVARHRDDPTTLILASGDGKQNEFHTSFYEILEEVLTHSKYASWEVRLASFDWSYPNPSSVRSPTSTKMKALVTGSTRGSFINLFDSYDALVFHKPWTPINPRSA